MKRLFYSSFILFTTIYFSQAQTGKIEGTVFNSLNNNPIPFANVVIWQTTTGTVCDADGNFKLTGLKPGYVKLAVSSIGYKTTLTEDIFVTNSKTASLDVLLNEASLDLKETTVKASPFRKTAETPLSMRTINLAEIEKSPGANRDISKVIQSFPGVSSGPAFRNDLVVRGGGTSENRFYLDGVEIPNINHFATQGSSGGPAGIINVDFLREVDFLSGAFPASEGNALSSILNFKLIDGNTSKYKYRATLGASDIALTGNGPISKKTTMIFSVRRSYLSFLFNALGLPFLPTYNDFTLKTKIHFDKKNELTIIGLGAIDQFNLNTGIKNPNEYQKYILDYLPVNEQWNYTVGLVYKHFREHGVDDYVLSRNMLNNVRYKYFNNDESNPANKILDYTSQEIENKFRYERTTKIREYKVNYGVGAEYAKYNNKTFQKVFLKDSVINLNYNSQIDFFKYSGFGQISRSFINEKLTISAGFKLDGNNYSTEMTNPLDQFSPRLSISYQILPKYSINFNTGRYYQLPPYTSLGYRNNAGELVNKTNKISYISADHIVAGLEYQPNQVSKITIEGFYKIYHNYPFSLNDSISLANKGADYGTYGDEAVTSTSNGRSYGIEVLARETDWKGFNFLLSYTYVRSEFADQNNKYIPSAWDNRNILNLTVSRIFKHNWQIGIKWRYAGGTPYTPYDINKSSLIAAWDVKNQPYIDYSKYNSERAKPFHQLDLRIDKSYFFKKWSLMFYIDVQNLYNFKSEGPDFLTNRDVNGNPVIDQNNTNRYVLRPIKNESGTVLPSIGIMIEL
jgi:hypothetical protein